jgi:signal transduction histidine kinase
LLQIKKGITNSPYADAAAAVASLTDDLIGDAAGPVKASQALDRLRHRLQATDALLWIVDGGIARPALRAGASHRHAGRPPDIDGAMLPLDRLRRNGTVFCGVDDLSGIEELAPQGVNTFLAAAATPREAVCSVLVLGWTEAAPAGDETAFAPLRIAAGLLGRAVTTAQPSDGALTFARIVQSLPDSVVVVDREGFITAVNAAWTASAHRRGLAGPSGPGMNYVDLCRRAAAGGSVAATVTLKAIEEVRRGGSFQTTYELEEPADDAWAILTISPLDKPAGGAILVHSDVAPRTVADLTRRLVDTRINRIVDALPGPVWIAAPDGRVIYASRHWAEMSGTVESSHPARWLDAVHADDRARAETTFAAAVRQREGFEVDVRLWSRGTYGVFTCVAAPLVNADGAVESYAGVCVTAGGRHRAGSALDTVAARLLAAQEAERSRIARDLHDDLGQRVVLLETVIDAALKSRAPDHARSVLRSTRRRLREMAASIHTLVHTLHPAKLKLLGLLPTLEAFCRDITAEGGQRVRFAAHDVPPGMDEDVVLCIFRVVQEAVQNALKHSGATTIDVHLAGAGPWLTLRVSDDGTGFDPNGPASGGLGLLTMRERVELAGGTLTVNAAPGRGTAIEVTVNANRRAVTA